MTRFTPSVPSDVEVLAPFAEAGVLGPGEVQVAATVARLHPGLDPSVLLAVAVATRAPTLGHVGIELARASARLHDHLDQQPEGLAWPDPERWAATLADSPVVAGPDGVDVEPLRPLVWDGTRVYLHRYWCYEVAVADQIHARTTDPASLLDPRLLDALHSLFPTMSDGGADLQRQAATAALANRLSVIAGGPGTGKTRTIARMLAAAHRGSPSGRPIEVALAAPTGKAAARMSEAVRQAVTEALGDGVIDGDLADTLRQSEASTIHSLLGWRPGTKFRHDRNRPLPHDLVVIDETSMVSLPLMARLLDAVRPDAQLVLVGDPDQLASVDAGTVMADLVGPMSVGRAVMPNDAAASSAGGVPSPRSDSVAATLTTPMPDQAITDQAITDQAITDEAIADPVIADQARAADTSANEVTAAEGSAEQPRLFPVDEPTVPAAAPPTADDDEPSAGAGSPHGADDTRITGVRLPREASDAPPRSRTGGATNGSSSTAAPNPGAGEASRAPDRRAVLAGRVTVLERVHRFSAGSGIATLASAVRAGDGDGALVRLAGPSTDVSWVEVPPGIEGSGRLAAVAEIEALITDTAVDATRAALDGDVTGALAAAQSVKVLAAVRHGHGGLYDWTARIEEAVGRQVAGVHTTARWYVGRPVIVTANDRVNRLTNGDTGIVVAGRTGPLIVMGEAPDLRRVPVSRVSEVETWWAMTIHKSQGSEFPHVVVSLPDATSPILTRELLYTAITRARERLTIVGSEPAVRAAIDRPVARASGLGPRLWPPSALEPAVVPASP